MGRWIKRQYYVRNFSNQDYLLFNKIMETQKESSGYIIEKMLYNPKKNTCVFHDKILI